MNAVREMDLNENFVDRLEMMAPVTALPNKIKKSQEHPIFHLEEYDSYYLFSIDLPSLQVDDLGIEVSKNQLQLTERKKGGSAPSSVLFQCDSSSKKVKAYYQKGVLWVVLPKNSLAGFLDLSRLTEALA